MTVTEAVALAVEALSPQSDRQTPTPAQVEAAITALRQVSTHAEQDRCALCGCLLRYAGRIVIVVELDTGQTTPADDLTACNHCHAYITPGIAGFARYHR